MMCAQFGGCGTFIYGVVTITTTICFGGALVFLTFSRNVAFWTFCLGEYYVLRLRRLPVLVWYGFYGLVLGCDITLYFELVYEALRVRDRRKDTLIL